MNDLSESPAALWRFILDALSREVAMLSSSEREWLQGRLGRIDSLQERMHALFLEAGGSGICRDCGGYCCDRGKNHLTLANLLPFLLEGGSPPEPDFSRSCPYCGAVGCLYEAGRRPFNCVTFLCDRVEEPLSPSARSDFYALERELRQIYLELDGRYAGSSLRGIFIRAPRLQGRSFLARP